MSKSKRASKWPLLNDSRLCRFKGGAPVPLSGFFKTHRIRLFEIPTTSGPTLARSKTGVILTVPKFRSGGFGKHPVVHFAYEDVSADAKCLINEILRATARGFASRELGKKSFWGNEFEPGGKVMANTWQGEFPHQKCLRREAGFGSIISPGDPRIIQFGLKLNF